MPSSSSAQHRGYRIAWPILTALLLCATACGNTPPTAGPTDTTVAADASSDADASANADGALADTGGSADTGSKDTASANPTAIDGFCDPWAAWACKRALQCGCTTPKNGTPTAELCLPWMKAYCVDDMKKISSGIQMGYVGIDPSRVPACIAWLDQQLPTCFVVAKKAMGRGPCAEWLHQMIGPDGKCQDSNMICPDGSGCVDHSCGAARLEVGAPCKNDSHCKSQWCDDDAKVCRAPLTAGSACTPGDPCPMLTQCSAGKCTGPTKLGQACTSTNTCDLMLTCTAGTCATGPKSCTAGQDCGGGGSCLGAVFNSCAAQLPVGTACTQDGQCSVSAWCDPAVGHCVGRPGVGFPCANGVLCAPGLGCSSEGQVCAALPKKGEACAMSEFGPMLCGPGLVCKTDAFVCSEPPLQGAPCNHHGNCSSSAGKDPADLVCAFGPTGSSCVKRQPKGSPCENDICAPGLFCNFKTNSCASVYPTGGACSAGNECGLSGSCAPDDQGKLRCVPMPKAGEACLMECADSLFCNQGMTNTTCQPPVCQLFYQLQ